MIFRALMVPLALAASVRAGGVLGLDSVLVIAVERSDEAAIIRTRETAGLQNVRSLKAAVFPNWTLQGGSVWQSMSPSLFLGSVGLGGDAGGDGGVGGGGAAGFQGPGSGDRLNGFIHQWSTDVYQPLITFGRLGTVIELARRQTELLGLERREDLDRFLAEVVQGYADAIVALHGMLVSRQSTRALEELHRMARSDYQAGLRSQLDALRAQAAVETARAQAARDSLLQEASRARLLNRLGLESRADVIFDTSLSLEARFLRPEPLREPGTPPELSIAKSQAGIHQVRARYERANRFPSIGLTGGISHMLLDMDQFQNGEIQDLALPDQWTYRVGLAATWTLFDGFAASAKTAEQRALAEISRREAAKLEREYKVRQEEAARSLTIGRSILAAAATGVEAAGLAYEQSRRDYRGGTESLADHLQAEADLRDAERRRVLAYRQVIEAAAFFRLAHGIPLSKGLQ